MDPRIARMLQKALVFLVFRHSGLPEGGSFWGHFRVTFRITLFRMVVNSLKTLCFISAFWQGVYGLRGQNVEILIGSPIPTMLALL